MKTLSTVNKITAYRDQCISIFEAVNGVKTIGDFVNQVEFLSKVFESDPDKLNSFKGDMLEILGEVFFDIYSADTAVGLLDYSSVPLDEDYGVDGIGTNVNGDLCAVQMKYRSNPLEKITYADIARTDTAGRRIHNLPLDKNDTIFLFTTGNDITATCQKVFGNIIRVIDRKIIAGYVDNNLNFWIQVDELIANSLDSLGSNNV